MWPDCVALQFLRCRNGHLQVWASGRGNPGSQVAVDGARPVAPRQSSPFAVAADASPPLKVLYGRRGGPRREGGALRRHTEGKLNPARQQAGQEITSSCSLVGG